MKEPERSLHKVLDNTSEEVSATFHVVGKPADQIKLYFFLLLGAIGMVGLLVTVNVILAQRRKI